MDLTTPRRTRVVLGLLAVVLAAAAVDGWLLFRDRRWNSAIEAGALPDVAASAPVNEPAEVRFARATLLAMQDADDATLRAFRALQADTPLGQSARFNSGNALMRQAFKVRGGDQPGQAIPLIELAKETYREVLRNDPDAWGARYNLERAQRLLPEPDESDAAAADAPRNAERAATTMRGVSPGLP